MKAYIWHHNRKFHSYSMISEPCINNNLYQEAILIVAANNLKEAIEIAVTQNEGWRMEDLEVLTPEILELDQASVIFKTLH